MNKKISDIKKLILILIVIEAVLLLLLHFVFDISIVAATVFYVIGSAALYALYLTYYEDNQKRAVSISDLVSNEATGAFLYGKLGILTYDEDYIITWMSELFEERGLHRISKKLLTWLPEVSVLFRGDSEKVTVEIDEYWYEITRKEDARVLYFKDITEQKKLQVAYNEEQLVVGLIHLDNYEESTQYSEEQEISMINNSIRQPIVDWCRSNGMLLKRLRSDRFFVVLNEKIFSQIASERFSILKQTRMHSSELDASITLSMAFARGSNDLQELDEMANSLLELAQSRGGDQVAIKKKDEDVKYFGGSSEAQEKRSRVRVRIMANALKGLIQRSSNIIICGHKEMDFDCMGSALCMSRITAAYGKQTCIIAKTGGMEEKLNEVMDIHKETLRARHLLVTESEAINQLREDTLVIMVDHHNPKTSNGYEVLKRAKKVAIFDHHRRSADLAISPILVYIEAGASSASELVSEFVPYMSSDVSINDAEATIMLAGMTVDTNRFRVRTGARTFDAASVMRKWGADPALVNEYLKDSYVDFETKNNVLKYCEKIENGVVLAAVEDRRLTRSTMSQIADSILSVKEVQAAFVIAKCNESETAISARSNGSINVQVIMERMQGGGHMTAAAVQREHAKVSELKEELVLVLKNYFKEEAGNEGHSVK